MSSIEELKQRCETPDAVFDGTKVFQGWKKGKMVTQEEYEVAVKAFQSALVDGKTMERKEVKA